MYSWYASMVVLLGGLLELFKYEFDSYVGNLRAEFQINVSESILPYAKCLDY